MINYGRQLIENDDIKAVLKTLKSEFLTQGFKTPEFEKEINKKFGGKYSCVLSNGTASLYLLGKALGWKKDDLIATTPISFIASSNCIVNNNATPEFIDIDNRTYLIDPNKLEHKLKKKKIKAVIAVDYAGHPCDWKSLNYLSKKYGFILINDACHSMGSEYYSNKKYAIKYAHFVTQSFHPVKAITTGEGGSVISDNKRIIDKIKLMRSHSMIKNSKKFPWMYNILSTGQNYRITDIQCALGISQLKKLDRFIKERRKIAKFYVDRLKDYEIFTLPVEKKNCKHSFHLFPLLVEFKKIRHSKQEVFKRFLKEGIKLQVHYIPIHLQPFYKKNFRINRKELENAEEFYRKEVSIPIFPGLKKSQLFKVLSELKRLY